MDDMKNIIMEPVLPISDDAPTGHSNMSLNTSPKNMLNTGAMYVVDMLDIPRSDEFDTGDILLFSDRSYIPSRMIEWYSMSRYSHVGILLKDPTYIDPELKGLYIFESTASTDIADCEDYKLKNGVQIRRLDKVYAEYNGAIFWRRLNIDRDKVFLEKIKQIHRHVHGLPYDFNPIHWIEALLDIKLTNVRDTTHFICSALVTYVYYRLGLVIKDAPWTIVRPKDFGTEFNDNRSYIHTFFGNQDNRRITFVNDNILDKEVVIKHYNLYVHYIYRTY